MFQCLPPSSTKRPRFANVARITRHEDGGAPLSMRRMLLKRSSISSRFTRSLSHCPTASFSSTSKNGILLLSKTSLPECDQCRSHCRPSSCYRHNTLEVPSSRSPSTSFPSSMRERTPSSCTQSHRPPNYVALHLIPPIPSAAVVACTAGYTHHRRVAYTTHPYGRTTK